LVGESAVLTGYMSDGLKNPFQYAPAFGPTGFDGSHVSLPDLVFFRMINNCP
jgi:hypothetical protein